MIRAPHRQRATAAALAFASCLLAAWMLWGQVTGSPLITTFGCQASTSALEEMPRRPLAFPNGETYTVAVAHTHGLRAAGMQHLCADVVDRTRMLFVFEDPRRVRFHMDNVHAPLDIAFIDGDGTVVAVQRITPEQHERVDPGMAIGAAIEVAAGRADALGLHPGSDIDLAGIKAHLP